MKAKKIFFLRPQQLTLIGLAACCLLLIIAYYQEYVVGIQPCLLCNIQRLCLFVLALLFFLASVMRQSPRSRKFYGLGVILFSLLGCFIAGRQVWLESQPPNAEPVCLPGMDYIWQLPAGEIWQFFLKSTASCGAVHWRLLGLSIAIWTLACFIGLTLMGVWLILHRRSALR